MLNPIHLRTLTAVIETGSFAGAARRLGYTGSAVSQQIAALERSVRIDLFERDSHSIGPTPAAEFLASRAHEVLADLMSLEDDMRAISGDKVRTIRIGSFPTASQQLLPAGLSSFQREYPSVDIQLDEGEPNELLVPLQDGHLDLILVYEYQLVPRSWPSGLVKASILDEQLVLLVPRDHRATALESISMVDLAHETWITSRDGTAGSECLVRLCGASGFVPKIGFRSNDYEVVRGFVRAGHGIALVPALGLTVQDDDIALLTVAGVKIQRRVFALYRRTMVESAIADAVNDIRAAAAKFAGDAGEHFCSVPPEHKGQRISR